MRLATVANPYSRSVALVLIMAWTKVDLLTASLVAAVSSLAIYLLWRGQQSAVRYPPGPLSLPMIGNLPGIALTGSMSKYLKECRKIYGNVSVLVFHLVFSLIVT